MSEWAYRLDGIQKTYGARTVLDIPALELAEGEIFAIVGPSGAGKSTLLRLLAFLEAPTRGTIRFGPDQIAHSDLSITDRRQVTMVFQRPVLLSRSVRSNVAYGLRLRGNRDGHQRISEMLARVSLSDLAKAHPRTLSGGEMQRVALARALVLEPRVLLLDEPTANLDPHNVRLIEDLLREQHARFNTTLVIVTHNVFQARRLATRVALLLDSQIVEVAPTETFFSAPRDPRTAAFISGDFVY
jgi:tungstate transport system ATP-binding protein